MLINYLQEQFTHSGYWERYTEDDFNLVKGFLDTLGVELPQDNQFYKTRDFGALLFLNDLGLTVRVTHQSKRNERKHPLVLEPLLSRETDRLHIGLYPGLKLLKQEEHQRAEADRVFENDRLTTNDTHHENLGRLPAPFEDTLIILDPECVDAVRINSFGVDANYKDSDQDKAFGPLKTMFSEAWPIDAAPCPEKIKSVLSHCRTLKNQGFLFSDWKTLPYKPLWDKSQNTADISLMYANNNSATYFLSSP